MRHPLIALPALLLATSPSIAEPPSFDCAEAYAVVAELVCGDQDLADLDREAERLHRLARDAADNSEAQRETLDEQRLAWIRERDGCWRATDVRDCALDSYVTRIHRLRRDHTEARQHDEEGISTGPLALACPELDDRIALTFVGQDPPHAYLEWPGHFVVATLSPAASGSKYLAERADGTYQLWIKRDEALLDLPDREGLSCKIEGPG